MSLSCECSNYDSDWYYYNAEKYTTLQTKKREQCVSCGVLINIGDIVTSHYCFRDPKSELEEITCGTEVGISEKYHCESCSDIEFNLLELGFCVQIGVDMRELIEEYKREYLIQK